MGLGVLCILCLLLSAPLVLSRAEPTILALLRLSADLPKQAGLDGMLGGRLPHAALLLSLRRTAGGHAGAAHAG